MPRYAAFLRGINVGGTRVAKDDLCEPFRALGFENVATFRASGNVLFDAAEAGDADLARRIEERLAADLGFTRATTFIRGEREMLALAEADPLPDNGGKLQVLLLLAAPPAAVLEFATEHDPLALGPKELFWRPRGRLTDSDLDLKAIEKLIGPTTTRTKGTIDQISERFFGST